MKYAEAAAVADAILAEQPDHALALNIGGVSNFANQNFEKAVQQFEAAVNADVLIPQLGGQYSRLGAQLHRLLEEGAADSPAGRGGNRRSAVAARQDDDRQGGHRVGAVRERGSEYGRQLHFSLAEQGFYDGLKFHRVIPNFMAQGGDPNTREGAVGQPGTGGPGYTIKCEAFEPDARRHFAGTLSMAHAGKDTGGSQFFITHLPTPHLDQEVRPESVHTVFGRVMEGMDVVRSLEKDDAIEKVEVIRKRNHEYKPVTQPSEK